MHSSRWRYLVSAASDPAVTSHAGTDELCGRNCRFVHDVSMTNNSSVNLMSLSEELSEESGERARWSSCE
jgi:hypothetical protein